MAGPDCLASLHAGEMPAAYKALPQTCLRYTPFGCHKSQVQRWQLGPERAACGWVAAQRITRARQ